MMKIWKLEVKRILKSKMTLVFIAVALGLSILLSVNLVQGMQLLDREYNKAYTGMDAIRKARELGAPHEGPVTPEKLLAINEAYVAAASEYGGTDNMPEEVYQERIWPLRQLVNLVGEITFDEETGFTKPPEERTEADILGYYENRDAFIANKLAEKDLRNNPVGLERALSINASVEKPFVYYVYTGWFDGGENLGILILLLVMILAAVTAPVFSSEYQTGSDSILRCTKNGRGKLAAAKICASLLIAVLLFMLCFGLMFGVFCAAFGTESFAASVQMVLSACIAPLTIGGMNAVMFVSGLLGLMAVIAFTLFVSSNCKTPMITLIIAVVMILAPTVIRLFGGGALAAWIRLCLPSSGLGLGSGMFYELLIHNTFLTVGKLAIWSPYMILGTSVVYTVLFILLTLRSYKRHEAA